MVALSMHGVILAKNMRTPGTAHTPHTCFYTFDDTVWATGLGEGPSPKNLRDVIRNNMPITFMSTPHLLGDPRYLFFGCQTPF
mmetsp:Transcript_99273/g.170891  ORF Transcript_99273/g.170891 Transcript_99273/m.170891 type:complete len:83 (-) Transcript_99273:16-264(-)